MAPQHCVVLEQAPPRRPLTQAPHSVTTQSRGGPPGKQVNQAKAAVVTAWRSWSVRLGPSFLVFGYGWSEWPLRPSVLSQLDSGSTLVGISRRRLYSNEVSGRGLGPLLCGGVVAATNKGGRQDEPEYKTQIKTGRLLSPSLGL
jgi:hypothetical protein